MFRNLFLAAALVAAPAAAQETPKNIIVMIADGAGYDMLGAARAWMGGPLEVDHPVWKRTSMATYALRRDAEGEGQDPEIVYDSAKAWDTRPLSGPSKCADGFELGYAGYEWHRCSYPDSANTMSAMMTGVRTYNGAINVDGAGANTISAAEVAKASGRRVGSISSVPFTHATPASGGGAHNVSRRSYHDIADEMLGTATLDFIAGGGNPDFDGDSRAFGPEATEQDRFEWLSPAAWAALKDGTSGWTLYQKRADVQDLAKFKGEDRIIVIPEVKATLQVERALPDGADRATDAPGDVPLNPAVPTLPELTRAALTHLAAGDEGLFLSIEGGAVDWAMHGNALGRAIEEYVDFNDAVKAVEAWLDDPATPQNWSNTLVIVTADHDHLLTGPDADVPFQPVEPRGRGVLPGHKWWSTSHSNRLVPFYARGVGADALIGEADEMDMVTSADGQLRGRGPYLAQPEMGRTLIDFLRR